MKLPKRLPILEVLDQDLEKYKIDFLKGTNDLDYETLNVYRTPEEAAEKIMVRDLISHYDPQKPIKLKDDSEDRYFFYTKEKGVIPDYMMKTDGQVYMLHKLNNAAYNRLENGLR